MQVCDACNAEMAVAAAAAAAQSERTWLSAAQVETTSSEEKEFVQPRAVNATAVPPLHERETSQRCGPGSCSVC